MDDKVSKTVRIVMFGVEPGYCDIADTLLLTSIFEQRIFRFFMFSVGKGH